MHAQHFLITEQERSIYNSSHFDIRRFRAEPTNYERCLHPSDTFAYRSAHNNLFLRLMHNPQVKKFVAIYRQLFFRFCFILFSFCFIFSVDLSLYYDKRGGRRGFFFFLQNILFFSNLNFSFKNIIFITYNKMWRASMLSCFPFLF